MPDTLPSRAGKLQGLTLEQRFWAYVVVPANRERECWTWTGERQKAGYALVRHKGKRQTASRIAWSIHHGKAFPQGKLACHSCDNPGCVNPHHIWPGSDKENMQDAIAKGRFRTRKAPVMFCKNGHPFSSENTQIRIKKTGKTMRVCRACSRNRRNRPEVRERANETRRQRRRQLRG